MGSSIGGNPALLVLIWMILCMIVGIWRGFARMLFPLISFIISGVFIIMAVSSLSIISEPATAIGAYIFLVVILNVIGHITGLINHIPIIGKLNRVLGGIFGLAIGIFTAFLAYSFM